MSTMSTQNSLSGQSDTQETQSETPRADASSASQSSEQSQRSSTSGSQKSKNAFKTISEVAEILDVQQHVLRFWETKFSQIRPLKRGGGRRYYRPEDVALLQTIHALLYGQGYTIKGVQKLLREQGKNTVVEQNHPAQDSAPANPSAPVSSVSQQEAPKSGLSENNRALLEGMLEDLKDLRKLMVSKKSA